jgi:DNA-binding MarR family transcriptional regulator
MSIYKEGLEEEIIRTFYELYNLIEVILKYKTNESLTLKESFILEVVKRLSLTNDNITSNIADILQISNPSASIAISALEKKGFLSRKPAKEDRRVIYIYLTKKADFILNKQSEFRKSAMKELYQALNLVERAALLSSMKKVRQFVKKDTERIKKDKRPIITKD